MTNTPSPPEAMPGEEALVNAILLAWGHEQDDIDAMNAIDDNVLPAAQQAARAVLALLPRHEAGGETIEELINALSGLLGFCSLIAMRDDMPADVVAQIVPREGCNMSYRVIDARAALVNARALSPAPTVTGQAVEYYRLRAERANSALASPPSPAPPPPYEDWGNPKTERDLWDWFNYCAMNLQNTAAKNAATCPGAHPCECIHFADDAVEKSKAVFASPAPVGDVPCRLCGDGAVGFYLIPEGCLCCSDHVQALCQQHAVTVESEGPIRFVGRPFGVREISPAPEGWRLVPVEPTEESLNCLKFIIWGACWSREALLTHWENLLETAALPPASEQKDLGK